MALKRTVTASLLVLAVAAVFGAACGGGDEPLEERWARLDVPEAEIVFLGVWADAERAAIEREVKNVQVSFAERFEVVTSEFTLYISTEREALNEAYVEWLAPEWRRRGVELPEWFTCDGFAPQGAIFIILETCDEDYRAYGGPIAHEYFHILQHHLGMVSAGGSNVWPTWLVEGSAVYASTHHAEEQGRWTVSWRRDAARLAWSGLGRPLPGPYATGDNSILTGIEFQDLVYEVGFLAVDWLVERKGEEALVKFFRLGGGRHEFEEAFGMTADAFVEAFEEQREQVAPPFEWRLAGTVLDADAQPVAHASVGALVWVGDEKVSAAGTETNARGVFHLDGPGSGYSLGVFLTCPGGNTVHGPWVFAGELGENGFVPDADGRLEAGDPGAEPFGGEEHRSDIVIQLPEPAEALLERHCES